MQLPEVRRQQRKRSERASEYRHARQNHAPGSHPVQQVSSTGEQAAIIIAVMPKASDAASRDHLNSPVTGFGKIPKVYTSSDAKLTNTPTPEAIATRHPG